MEWAARYQSENASEGRIDHFIFGHFHMPFTREVEGGGDLSILGDWIHNPDYLVFDGKTLERRQFSGTV